jgi:hypothetical protein
MEQKITTSHEQINGTGVSLHGEGFPTHAARQVQQVRDAVNIFMPGVKVEICLMESSQDRQDQYGNHPLYKGIVTGMQLDEDSSTFALSFKDVENYRGHWRQVKNYPTSVRIKIDEGTRINVSPSTTTVANGLSYIKLGWEEWEVTI